ncbi:MAG: NAD(P)/FAD-dependent oxidoreductase [Planctomycetota bacterium]
MTLARLYDVIVVGAGFAGAATALALAKAGVRKLLLVDRESRLGAQASGQNAAMIRTAVDSPLKAEYAQRGALELARRSDERAPGAAFFRRTGGILIGGAGAGTKTLVTKSALRRPATAELLDRCLFLHDTDLEDALEAPDDGVVDALSFLSDTVDEARRLGAEVAMGIDVHGPIVEHDRVRGIETAAGRIECDALVVATGAWAGKWARAADLELDCEPRLRHLITTAAPSTRIAADRERAKFGSAQSGDAGPWVWHLGVEIYFRPCGDGLLWSPCDEMVTAPGDCRVRPGVEALFRSKAGRAFPRARNAHVTRVAAGQRTFVADENFLLGPDPRVRGWHWAVGLGGHGVTVSAEVGRRVADALVGRRAIETEFAWRPSLCREGAF